MWCDVSHFVTSSTTTSMWHKLFTVTAKVVLGSSGLKVDHNKRLVL